MATKLCSVAMGPPALIVAVDGRLRITLVFFGPVTWYLPETNWPPMVTAVPDMAFLQPRLNSMAFGSEYGVTSPIHLVQVAS